MWATDISDILFGTPSPKVGEVNLGCLEEKQVNIIVHGHEPTLSEMIVTAVQDPELIAYAQSKGAEGINLAGICCTSNEVMVRQGIPSAGNFLCVDVGRPGREVFLDLLKRGVIARPVDNYGLPQHLRISIGSEAENARLIEALGAVLKD